jgi:hypothetical protein
MFAGAPSYPEMAGGQGRTAVMLNSEVGCLESGHGFSRAGAK